MERSRTKNVSINIVFTLFCQILNLVLNFASRTVLIKCMGADYLGVNGLFTNVLTILSFAELGIGNAIIFNMYKPLALGDNDKVASLLSLYRKAYLILVVIVTSLGLLLLPFLDYLIKGTPKVDENISTIYLLYLAGTVFSYILAYKKSIIIADQRNYIVIITTECIHFLQVAMQIFVLICYHNFLLFLIIQALCVLFDNCLASIIANKKYPYILKESEPLSKNETKEIFHNVKAMALYKIGSIILNSTSSLLISALISITLVGVVSNYLLLLSACNTILSGITNSFISSIGNLNATSSQEHKYTVFNKIFLITVWLYGFAAIGMILLSKYFIIPWIGEDFVLDLFVVFAIFLGFYVQGVHSVESNFRITMGYFEKAKYSALASSILNIVLALFFYKPLGVAGIFLAAPIARFAAIGLTDTIIIFKDGFNVSPFIYIYKNIGFLLLFTLIALVAYKVNSFISIGGWLGFVTRVLIYSLVFNIIMYLIFKRTKEFSEIKIAIKSIINR